MPKTETMRTPQTRNSMSDHANMHYQQLLNEIRRHNGVIDQLTAAIRSENARHQHEIHAITNSFQWDGGNHTVDVPMETCSTKGKHPPKVHRKLTKQEKQEIRQRVRAASVQTAPKRRKWWHFGNKKRRCRRFRDHFATVSMWRSLHLVRIRPL